MKKVLSSALALGLLAGVASTASAADFSYRGYYKVEGFYLENGFSSEGVDVTTAVDKDSSSAWLTQESRLYPTLQVNDKTKVIGEVRFMSEAFGSQENDYNETKDIIMDKLYFEWMSPLGKLRAGRIPWAKYGFSFNDSGTQNDGFVFWPDFGKDFGLTLVHGKITEVDSIHDTNTATATTSHANSRGDHDADYYDVRVGLKGDAYNINTRIQLSRTGEGLTAANTNAAMRWQNSGYGQYNMDNLYIKGEWAFEWGDNGAATAVDYDGSAMMVAVGGKFDALDAELMYWNITGDNTNDTNDDAYGSVGNDFNPLLILSGDQAGLLNADGNGGQRVAQYGNLTSNANNAGTGSMAFVASFGYQVSDKLSLSSAIGWAEVDEAPNTVDDELGYEINVGAKYKLLDNLSYSANFGYWDVGDYFKGTNKTQFTLQDDSVMLLHHELNLTF